MGDLIDVSEGLTVDELVITYNLPVEHIRMTLLVGPPEPKTQPADDDEPIRTIELD